MVAVYHYGWTDRKDFIDESCDEPLYYITTESDLQRALNEHPDWRPKEARIRAKAGLPEVL